MRSDERVEELMDAALRSYVGEAEVPETRVTIGRVMARAREIEGRRRIWIWAVMAPAVVCLLAAVAVGARLMRGPQVAEIAWLPRAPGIPAGVSTVESRPFQTNGASGKGGAPGIRGGSSETRGSSLDPLQFIMTTLPKMEVFPTPRPLSAQERALVGFAAQASPAAKREVVEAEKHLGDPIVIAELKIEPLEDKSRE
jgi:hypothetical protein